MASQASWGETVQLSRGPSCATAWGEAPLQTTESAKPNEWTEDDQLCPVAENRGLAPGPYVRGAVLGRGGWGDVYKVLRLADGRVFAGKASKAIPQMQQEARTLRSLKHKHILEYIDWYEEQGNPAATLLVTELCNGGMLQTRINNASHGMEAADILRVIHQIAGALGYVHQRGLFHTDVKPHNILVRRLDPIDVVLADCADVRAVGRARKTLGTKKYWSPEMVRHGRHAGTGDDVWALGLTTLGMLAQWPRMVFTVQGLREYPRKCADHARALEGLNPGHEIVGLLCRMLAWDVSERASADECGRCAGELLEGMQGGKTRWTAESGLGIKAPRDFKPVEFW